MLRPALHGLTVAALAALAFVAQQASAARAVPQSPPRAAPLGRDFALARLAAVQPSLVADALYLSAVAQFGLRSTQPDDYRDLCPTLAASSRLDPNFAAPYILAGTALSVGGMDKACGKRLLAQGAHYLRDNWRIQFLFGTQTYFDTPSDHAAAEALAHAATLGGAPPYLAHLAARVAAQAHDPALGLALLDALQAQTEDPDVLASYAERQRLLQLELTLNQVQNAIDAYAAKRHTWPKTFTDLVSEGLLEAVPTDPAGGALGIDGQGHVTTRHERQRLSHVEDAQVVPAKDAL